MTKDEQLKMANGYQVDRAAYTAVKAAAINKL